MMIKKIRLRGFIGIKRGLGLEEITVDFDELQGLVALEGANGVGKTTFLENLQPFRMLPSRTGTLKSHCYLKDSFKEFTFEFNGHPYRTLIKTDATTTRPDEGYIYHNNAQSSLTDGKVSNYDAFIEKLLGSPALFFSSIFCAQNSRQVSDMKPAELKDLFAEFLRLDRYVTWENTAKTATRICSNGITTLDNQASKIDTKIRMMGDPRNDLKGAEILLKKAKASMEEIDSKHIGAVKVIEMLKKQVIENEQKQHRVKDQENMIKDLEALQTKRDNTFQEDSITRAMKLEDMAAELVKMHKVVERKDDIDSAVEQKLMIQAKIADQNATLSNIVISHQQHGRQKDAIQRQIHDTNNELNGLEYDKELQDLIEARNVRVRNGKEIKAKIESINSDHRMVKAMAEIESMEKHAKVLEDIDPACTSEICGLITVSLEARDNLPEAKEESLKLRKSIYLDLSIEKTDAVAEYVKAKDAVIARQAEVDKLIAVKEQINKENEERIDELDDKTEALNVTSAAVSKEIDSSMDRLGELTPLAEKLPQLVSAEAVAANLVKDIEALEVLTLKEQDTYQDAKQGIVVRIGAAKSIIDSIEINMEAETQLTDAQASLLELTKLQTQAEADKNRFANAIPQYEKEIEDLEVLEAELKATLEKTKFARGEMADWDYIRYACSKDGMRALEIEAVAPGITKNANDLLTGTFGPSHSVRFETQDDDGKEILRIIVILPDGSETPLDLQSGGEKVWILKALRLAQTLISQEKSGRHFQAALMDEEDGALSSKNAIKFIKLYRTFMGTAKMDQCCYISHRPEAVSMADNILQFRPGKITIV